MEQGATSEHVQASAQDIEISIEIEAPLERIWEAIATQERLRDWFNAEMRFEPRVGGQVEFAGLDGDEPFRFGGRVTEFEPPRRLTWEWGWLPPRWPEPTLLTMTLTPKPSTVLVELRQHGWERLPADNRDATYAAFRQGWHGDELIPLKELVEGVGPTS
jgi:uncharacterized protein YndB with AHSA1/START domain